MACTHIITTHPRWLPPRAAAPRVLRPTPMRSTLVTPRRSPAARAASTPPPTPAGAPHWRWDETDDAVRTYCVQLGVLAVGPVAASVIGSAAVFPYFLGLVSVCVRGREEERLRLGDRNARARANKKR